MEVLEIKKREILKGISDIFKVLNEDDVNEFKELLIRKIDEKEKMLNRVMEENCK